MKGRRGRIIAFLLIAVIVGAVLRSITAAAGEIKELDEAALYKTEMAKEENEKEYARGDDILVNTEELVDDSFASNEDGANEDYTQDASEATYFSLGEDKSEAKSEYMDNTPGDTTGSDNNCMEVLKLINDKRAEQGMPALSWSDALTSAASVRAKEASESWSHTRPDGTEFWTVDPDVQYAENLAKQYFNAESVFNAWMESPTHRDNIMNAEYQTIGMAIYYTEDDMIFWAQEFGY